jgi:hypothetical protein
MLCTSRGAIEETEPNARTCGLNMAISILFSLKNGNLAHLFPQKKSFAQVIVPFFVTKWWNFITKKTLVGMSWKWRYVGTLGFKFIDFQIIEVIYTRIKFDSQHVIVRKYTTNGCLTYASAISLLLTKQRICPHLCFASSPSSIA